MVGTFTDNEDTTEETLTEESNIDYESDVGESDVEKEANPEDEEEIDDEDIVIEDEQVNINNVKLVPKDERVTREFLDKNELARIFATRIAMLEKGGKAFVDISDTRNNYDIAKKELMENKLPFLIRRKIGLNKVEMWSLSELKINSIWLE